MECDEQSSLKTKVMMKKITWGVWQLLRYFFSSSYSIPACSGQCTLQEQTKDRYMKTEHMKQGNFQEPFLADDNEGPGLILYSGLPLKVQEQHVKRRYCCKPSTIILCVIYMETTALYGISANLVVYLHSVLHGNNASNATTASTWVGVSFLMTVFGAVVADSYWGKYKTILISLLILVVGMAIIAMSATMPSLRPPPCELNSCISATPTQKLVLYSGLYISAIGCGGVKSTLLTFGAEQFDNNKQQGKEKASYFSWSYAIVNLALFTAGTVLVWTEERIGWGLGYGICASFTAVAAMCFVMGAPTYRILLPEGSPLTGIFQVLTAFASKAKLKAPLDTNVLYDEDVNTKLHLAYERLEHTDQFRFLDEAAIIIDSNKEEMNMPSKLCTLTEVERLKILLRLLPLWATTVVHCAGDAQVTTTFVQQGSQMDTRIVNSFSVPPASMASFKLVTVTACILLYDKVVVPMGRRYFNKTEVLTHLQRMGIGHLMMAVGMSMASYTEACRLERARAGLSMNIRWQLPHYLTIAVADSFMRTSQLEFFYNQSPKSMRSMITALFFLSISFGHFLSSQIITLVSVLTTSEGKVGWIPPDLNDGHLDYYYLVFAGICLTNFLAYVLLATKYTPKRVTDDVLLG